MASQIILALYISALGSQILTALSNFFGGDILIFLARCIMASFFWVLECGFRQTVEFLGIFFEPPDVGLAVFQVFLDLEYRWFFDTLWSLDIMIKQHPDIEVYG
ncbi:hypothetical protein RhiirA5_427475 [Rhizophagus irregularis]|uniref:Uncharacterized protein n=1 Tax=Rhizophagus irregularis TaxID=588596 RepID=A0A2I1FC23_9GLOM|nr:hypothetical protein RhiirA5_427475 [Rhizophagus irregularis]PKC57967.1 hypothetical protein RhiirA1_471680 [Rhizophagus irregularis]PKY31941.1 hypothetical protein RhiirB3_449814 [Rhizophagus irregularis]